MKGMPFSYEFQGKRVDFVSDYPPPPLLLQQWKKKVGCGKNHVLDNKRSSSPPISSLGSSIVSGKCGILEDWQTVLSEFSTSPSPDQSMMLPTYSLCDLDDPDMGLSKMLQNIGPSSPLGFDFDTGVGSIGDYSAVHEPPNEFTSNNNGGSGNANNLFPISHQVYQQLQYQNYSQQHLFEGFVPDSLIPKVPFLDSGQQHHQLIPTHHQLQHQHVIIQQHIFNAVELVEMGNLLLAQEILARLNHLLSPMGNPFERVAYYLKESLNLVLLRNGNGEVISHPSNTFTDMSSCSPFSLVFKIDAYKSFSEISPLVQFANFTCNQAILEAVEGFDRIHIMDFDIGYGGQWASFMQELSMRKGGPPSLKITVFASPSTHDELELSLTRENLNVFAREISIPFDLEIINLEMLNSMPLHLSNSEVIAVNLPVSAFSNCPLSFHLVLQFVKHLCPKIVVSIDRSYDRLDLPFADHVIHALESYSSLLGSIEAVNLSPDTMQKIEKFLIHPGIEKVVLARHRSLEKTPPWKSLFLSSGFSPLKFSNFNESQADYIVQRTLAPGFHIEKRQSSLILWWQQKDLISASAWRC